MTQISKEHKVAIILALLLSAVSAFPQVYFRIDHNDINQGIELLPDSPWSPRVREVQDGHPNFGSIYYKDGKDLPYLHQPLPSMVVAYMGEIFSLDINNTLLLSRLLLSFVVFFLIYGFVLLFSKDKFIALASASLLLFADSILSFSGLSALLHGLSPDSFLRLSRPVNPAMIYILLFGFLIPFWKFYNERKWKYGILSAIVLGLNFHSYFYSWTYLYAFGGLLVLTILFRKRWKEALRIGSVFVGGLVVAIPYVINLHRVSSFPTYEEAGIRLGIILTHGPLFTGFFVILALAFFLIFFPRENKEKYVFALGLLLTPFITMNQQILTGKIMQADHYHWFFHKPLGVILVLMTLSYLMLRHGWEKYRKIFFMIVVVISVGTGVFVQTHSYFYDKRDGGQVAIERQKYGPVMDWLNTNATKEAVVLGNDETSHLTVIYTPLNVFYHRAGYASLVATKERLLDSIFTFYRLRGVEARDAKEIFFQERDYISANIYGIYYRKLLGDYGDIPDDKIEEILSLYQQELKTASSPWLENILLKYNVEYLVWDKKGDPSWDLDKYRFLSKVAEFGDLVIYHKI